MDMHVTEADLGKALQESAMLANVRISLWEGTKTDRGLMEQVKTQHNAKGNVGKLQKNMLAGVDGPLRAVRSAFANVRVRHYQLTLPWVTDPTAMRAVGSRLLCHPILPRYLTELGQLQRVADDALNTFLPLYPVMVKDAATHLGGMYNRSDYPSVDEVRSRFKIHRDFEPIPDRTGFRGLPGGMIERLSHHLAERQKAQLAMASEAMWTEAKYRVAHLIDRLEEEDTKFKEATVRQVRELVSLLPGWNLGRDERAGEIASAIEDMLKGIDAEDLRKDHQIRAGVVEDARKIAGKMEEWAV